MKRIYNLLLIALVMNVFAMGHVAVKGQTREEELRENLLIAFESVYQADRMGGDVSGLVEDLSEALRLIKEGEKADLDRAEEKIRAVLSAAPLVESEGIVSTRNQQILTGTMIGLVVFFGIVVWRLGPRFFWSLWLRSKWNWRVRR